MEAPQFCYWLQGFFELRDLESHKDEPVTLTNNQVKCIQAHLNLVFVHDIDPKQGNTAHQKRLQSVHDSYKREIDSINKKHAEKLVEFESKKDPKDVIYRC